VVDDAVKMLGCALVVMGVAVVAFIGIAMFAITNTDDQSSLTREVESTVLEADRRSAGPATAGSDYEFDITYTYRLEDQTYRGDTTLSDNEWGRGDALLVCVDPDEPTAHVVKVEAEPCGSDRRAHHEPERLITESRVPARSRSRVSIKRLSACGRDVTRPAPRWNPTRRRWRSSPGDA
jgi:hypothetical protein